MVDLVDGRSNRDQQWTGGPAVAEVISDININLALVEDGQAFAYRQYLSGCAAREYLDAD